MSDWKRSEKEKAKIRRGSTTERIRAIPRYDWLNDPKKYCTDGDIKPKERCIHCGSKFLGFQESPFCVDCYTAMWMGRPEEIPAKINSHLRVPDDYNFETNQIERREDKIGSS